MNYRKRILEFRSNISEQDVKDGEDVLRAYGVPEEDAKEAMRLASHKLPIKCKFVVKQTEATEEE